MSANPVNPKPRRGDQQAQDRKGDPGGVEERRQERAELSPSSAIPKRSGTQDEDKPDDMTNEETGPAAKSSTDEDKASQPGRDAAKRAPRPGTWGSDENTGGFNQREAPEEKAY